jgi:tetratricopeptide (TPR) repeat protein
MYTENIEAVFGEESLEASNCYFLVGCYYAEEGHLLKGIACFKRAAQIRGEESGECYFNMGILYKRLGKNHRAIDMFNKALQKRSELYGDFTNEVAEVH